MKQLELNELILLNILLSNFYFMTNYLEIMFHILSFGTWDHVSSDKDTGLSINTRLLYYKYTVLKWNGT